MAQCTDSTKLGKRCTRQALKGKKLCFWHDPDSRARFPAVREKIGKSIIRRNYRKRHHAVPQSEDDVVDVAVSQYLIAVNQLASIVLFDRLRRKKL
jgi:hypothetical protein